MLRQHPRCACAAHVCSCAGWRRRRRTGRARSCRPPDRRSERPRPRARPGVAATAVSGGKRERERRAAGRRVVVWRGAAGRAAADQLGQRGAEGLSGLQVGQRELQLLAGRPLGQVVSHRCPPQPTRDLGGEREREPRWLSRARQPRAACAATTAELTRGAAQQHAAQQCAAVAVPSEPCALPLVPGAAARLRVPRDVAQHELLRIASTPVAERSLGCVTRPYSFHKTTGRRGGLATSGPP